MFPMKGNMKYESADGARQPGMRKDQFLVDFARRGANTFIEFMISRPASDPVSLSLSRGGVSSKWPLTALCQILSCLLSPSLLILFPANDPVKEDMRGKQSSQRKICVWSAPFQVGIVQFAAIELSHERIVLNRLFITSFVIEIFH